MTAGLITLLSLREKLEGAAARGSLFGGEFVAVIELYDQNIQQRSGNRTSRVPAGDDVLPPAYFTENDIYTDRWPSASPLFSPALTSGGFNQDDALAFIHSFFQTESERGQRPTSPIRPGVEDTEGESLEPDDVQRVLTAQSLSTASHRPLRLFNEIENSLRHPDYATSRPPARLASDISVPAIFVIFARLKGGLTATDHRDQTMSMWKVLFFGDTGNDGVVPQYLDALSYTERSAAIDEFC